MARGPWSVKGIDPKAREAARERAQREGVTLGAYLNRLLLADDNSQIFAPGLVDAITSDEGDVDEVSRVADAVDDLARRLEASERRSSSAMSGLDQSMLGLVTRIEAAERAPSDALDRFSSDLDMLRQTQANVLSQMDALKRDDRTGRALQAMGNLEGALSRLVAQVQERHRQVLGDQAQFKAEMEGDVTSLKSRLDSTERDVGSALDRMSDAASRMEAFEAKAGDAINSALNDLKHSDAASGSRNKDLADKLFGRVDDLETRLHASHSNVASMMGRVSDITSRIERVEKTADRTDDDMETAVDRINDRLTRAEKSTDAAIKSLETSFTSVDSRLAEMQRKVSETSDLRETFQRRFDNLTEDMARALADTRSEMQRRIDDAARNARPEAVDKLGDALSQLQDRLEKSEDRQARVVETVSEQLTRMSSALDRRLASVESRHDTSAADIVREEIAALSSEIEARIAAVEAREAGAIESVGEEVGKLADKLEERVRDSERQTAEAIESVGGQVARVADRLEARQDDAFKTLSEQVDEVKQDHETRLSDALAGMTKRFDEIVENADGAIEPLRNTVSSIAKRVELIEDGGAPPPPFDAPPADPPSASQPDDAEPASSLDDLSPLSELEEELGLREPTPKDDSPESELDAVDDLDAEMDVEADNTDDFDPVEDLLSEELDAQIASDTEVDTEADAEADVEDAWEADAQSSEPDETEPREDDASAFEKALAEDAASDAPSGASELEDNDVLEFEVPAAPPTDADPLRSDAGRNDDPFARLAAKSDAPKENYLAAARRAALDGRNTASVAVGATPASRRGGKLPIVAASALAIAVAGGGAVAMMRGKQDPSGDVFTVANAANAPSLKDQTSTEPVDAGVATNPEAAGDASDEDLFETAAMDDPLADIEAAAVEADASVDEALLFPETSDENAAATPEPAEPEPIFEPMDAAELTKPASIEDAAAGGDLAAIYELAVRDLDAGEKARGAEALKRAASRGLTIAQYRLAKLYERGEGVPRSVAESRKWTEQAASAGNVKAMHDLAVFYAEGDGGPQSYVAAAEWFRRAAEFGLVDSQYNVGVLYEQGLGVSQNLSEAAFWYEVAGRAGDPDGARRALELSRQTPALDYESVRQRAAAFAPTPSDARANGRLGAPSWETASVEDIRDAQRLLTRLGYDPGPVDGAMGAKTRRAVRAFERDNQLTPSGQINSALIRQLNAATLNTSG